MFKNVVFALIVAFIVSSAAVIVSIPLGQIHAPYAGMSFWFVPAHLSDKIFITLMAKAYAWLFSVSFVSSLVTFYVHQKKST